MPQSEENLGDTTTIFRREDTVPVGVQEEFGHYLVVIGARPTRIFRVFRVSKAPHSL